MKSFFVLYYAAVCAVTIVGFARCEQAAVSDEGDGSAAGEPQRADRRSIGEYHGLYEPSYYAPHYHTHGLQAAAPDHYHLHATAGYYGPARYHGLHGYAPGHYHYDLHHETAVHGTGFRQRPIVYQSVVNSYPTATTVVHKPVPVPVAVAHPVPVPVARPVPVEVPRPYPVPVNRPYPVTVVKPVPVPVAQPYPVAVYRPYPVPVYRPLPAATVVRPTAVRVPLHLRPYPVQPAATSYVHSHRVYAPSYSPAAHYAPPPRAYAPHYHGAYPTAAAASSYLQQLSAVRAVAGGGLEYDVNDAAAATAQQQTFQEDYNSYEQQEAAVAADGRHHDDLGQYRLHKSAISEDGGGYPSLTADETFKTSLGVPSTDYAGKK